LCITPVFAQWQAQDTGYPEGIGTIFTSIVDENIVWTVGGHEITTPDYHGFSKTINGGTTWTVDTIFVDNLDNFRFTSVYALSDSVAWVTMVNDVAPVYKGKVLKTIDGGDSWIHQSTAFPDDSVIARFPALVYFYDENNGFAVGHYGQHYITSDGGNLWTPVVPENLPTLLDNEQPFTSNVWPIGDSTAWYGTSKGRILKTKNGGQSWSAYDVGLGEQVVFASFKDELNGLATTPAINRNIAKTTDGGETWQTLPNQLPVSSILIYVKGTDNTYMYGSGDLPTLTGSSNPGSGFTVDDGNTWMFRNDMPLEPFFAVNSSAGWAAGNTFDNNIYMWTGPDLDASYSSENWEAQYIGFPEMVMPEVSIVDENTAWAFGSSIYPSLLYPEMEPFPNQDIARTTDGGLTWSLFSYTGDSLFTRSISALNDSTAWIIVDKMGFFEGKIL
jgi:photosystem II stability/assembly factor-like uncharacterized protein